MYVLSIPSSLLPFTANLYENVRKLKLLGHGNQPKKYVSVSELTSKGFYHVYTIQFTRAVRNSTFSQLPIMSANQSMTQPGGKPKPTLNSIYDSFGGRNNFLRSYGLKPYDADDVEEGKEIAQTMLGHDWEDWEECRKAEAVKAANTTLKSTSQDSGK